MTNKLIFYFLLIIFGNNNAIGQDTNIQLIEQYVNMAQVRLPEKMPDSLNIINRTKTIKEIIRYIRTLNEPKKICSAFYLLNDVNMLTMGGSMETMDSIGIEIADLNAEYLFFPSIDVAVTAAGTIKILPLEIFSDKTKNMVFHKFVDDTLKFPYYLWQFSGVIASLELKGTIPYLKKRLNLPEPDPYLTSYFLTEQWRIQTLLAKLGDPDAIKFTSKKIKKQLRKKDCEYDRLICKLLYIRQKESMSILINEMDKKSSLKCDYRTKSRLVTATLFANISNIPKEIIDLPQHINNDPYRRKKLKQWLIKTPLNQIKFK